MSGRSFNFLLTALAGLCVAAAVARTVNSWPRFTPDRDVLFFLGTAGALLLGQSITKIKIGEFEFERVVSLEDRVNELADVSRTQALPTPQSTVPAAAVTEPSATEDHVQTFESAVHRIREELYKPPLKWEDDPVLSRRALVEAGNHSSSAAGEKTLSATVLPSTNFQDLFRIELDVSVARREASGADDRVAFFLHHSFAEPVRIVPLQERRASITILARGSFTAGAYFTDGTFLTLDLSKMPLPGLTSKQERQFRDS